MVAKDGQETSRNPGKQNFQLFNFTSAPNRWSCGLATGCIHEMVHRPPLKKPGQEAKDSKGYSNQKWWCFTKQNGSISNHQTYWGTGVSILRRPDPTGDTGENKRYCCPGERCSMWLWNICHMYTYVAYSCGKRPICRWFMMIYPFWTVIFQFAMLN